MSGCAREGRTAAAVRSGRWTAELSRHLDECPDCEEVALVATALAMEAAQPDPEPLPDPHALWLSARWHARRRQAQRATRAVVVAQRAGWIVAAAAALAWLPTTTSSLVDAVAALRVPQPDTLTAAVMSPGVVMTVTILVLAGLAAVESFVGDTR